MMAFSATDDPPMSAPKTPCPNMIVSNQVATQSRRVDRIQRLTTMGTSP